MSHDQHVTTLCQTTLPMPGGKDMLVLSVDAQEFVDHVIRTRTEPRN